MGTNHSDLADITCQIQPWIYRNEFWSSLLRATALCPLEPKNFNQSSPTKALIMPWEGNPNQDPQEKGHVKQERR
jgi:hypothetical protein